MHCTNCGAQIAPNARFCANCGAGVDAEATRLAPRPPTFAPEERAEPIAGNLEKVIFTTRPTLLFIAISYGAAALGGILLTVIFALLSLPNVSSG